MVSARAREATLRIASGTSSSELDANESSFSASRPSRLSREPSSSAARADESARTARATRHPSSKAIVRTMTRSLPVAPAAASARRSSASPSEPSSSSPRAARLKLSSSSSSRSYATPRTIALCAFAAPEPVADGRKNANIVRPSGPQPRIGHLWKTRPSTPSRSNAGLRTHAQDGALESSTSARRTAPGSASSSFCSVWCS